MPGPEGSTPGPQGPQEPKREGFFARIFKRGHEGSGVVGLDPGAQAELEAARNLQASQPEAVSQAASEVPTLTRREELLASADARGLAGHKDTASYGEMPGAPQTAEVPAPTAEAPQAAAEQADELREAA